MDFQHTGSFPHSVQRLSYPWGRDPWGPMGRDHGDVTHGSRGSREFVSSSYSFPQHCMPYRLSVGAGLFTNLFFRLVINTHEREMFRSPRSGARIKKIKAPLSKNKKTRGVQKWERAWRQDGGVWHAYLQP